jgi:hypothetical protein
MTHTNKYGANINYKITMKKVKKSIIQKFQKQSQKTSLWCELISVILKQSNYHNNKS